jgi:hypothetical protein
MQYYLQERDMDNWTRFRWFPFCFFFGFQRYVWGLVLWLLIPNCKTEVDEKIAAKVGKKIGTSSGEMKESEVLDEIYKFLGILDGKASALMRYNGIVLAVIAVMVRQGQQLPGATYYIVYMTIASIMACLLVVGVFWRFLDWVNPTAEGSKLSTELDMIRRVLVLREAAYQIAWWLSGAVAFVLLIKFQEFVPK